MIAAARRSGIPSRPPGVHSRPEMITRLSADIPSDIRRAVEGGLKGWHRLRRFQTAMTFPTIEAAAAHLGAHQSALVHQFKRLERDVGGRLYHPSAPHRPMRPTARGTELLRALAGHRSRPWPRRRHPAQACRGVQTAGGSRAGQQRDPPGTPPAPEPSPAITRPLPGKKAPESWPRHQGQVTRRRLRRGQISLSLSRRSGDQIRRQPGPLHGRLAGNASSPVDLRAARSCCRGPSQQGSRPW